MDQWRSVGSVALEMKVHRMTVYRLIHAGKLSAVKVGRAYRINQSDFENYLKQGRTDVPRSGA